jgi:drug/metabolite transporter (DMT)-like permease
VAHLSFVTLCLIWGTSFIMIERARHAFGPVDVAFGRLLGGTVVTALVWFLAGRSFRFAPRDWWRIAFAAFVGSVAPYLILAYCIAPGRFGHSYFGMLMALVPIATIVVSVPMLGVWPTTRQLVGVLGGLLCVFLMAQVGSDRGMSAGFVALALAVPICYAVGNTFIKWQLSHLPSSALTALLLGSAAVVLLPFEFTPSLLAKLKMSRPVAPRDVAMSLAALAFLGAICTGMAIWIFNRLIVERGPLFASMVTYVFPIVALGVGYLDGETITSRQLAAMAGVLAMVAVVQLGGAKDGRFDDSTVVLPGEAGSCMVETAEICPATVESALLESGGEPK